MKFLAGRFLEIQEFLLLHSVKCCAILGHVIIEERNA
jgi:hypothetical protein